MRNISAVTNSYETGKNAWGDENAELLIYENQVSVHDIGRMQIF
jgi:hypothetical protein